MHSATGRGGESLTVHQLIQRTAPDYRKRFGPSMPGRHRQVLRKTLACRTPALGGELFQCPDCPGFHYQYHSCNDRHCPQCGQTDADAWLERQRTRLLFPVPYFLVTFTLPEELRRFIRSQLQIGLDLLFAASARALQDLAANPRRLGAQLGLLGVLHTWSRTLIFHPHIHYLIHGGGLSPDGRRWISARNQFLLHHKPLGDRFRNVFKERLLREHPDLFKLVPARVWKRHWNVGCQHAGSGQNALRYLSRYVFKTATNNRIVTLLGEGKVRWPYRDSQTGKDTAIKLDPLDWLSRFLQHILPPYFARVRTFGWLHPAAKVRGNRVRALLGRPPVLTPAEKDTWQPTKHPQLDGPDDEPANAADTTDVPARSGAPLCPRCRQVMRRVGTWKAGQMLPLPNRPP